MLRSLQHPVNSHFCTYTHLLPGVVDTFSHTHTVRDTLVGSCTISEEEEDLLPEEEEEEMANCPEHGKNNMEHWRTNEQLQFEVKMNEQQRNTGQIMPFHFVNCYA